MGDGSKGHSVQGTSATRVNDDLFSLVVPTLNRYAEVERLLKSLAAQTDRNFEVVIVDQNKGDGLVGIIEAGRRTGLDIIHVRSAQAGAAYARNVGVRHTSGALIGFPDDDCWYESDVVERARAFFSANQDIAGIGAHWVEFDPENRRPAAPFSPEAWRRYQGGDAPCFALFFRREAFEGAGGFSENFGVGRFFGSAEEEDIILTLLAQGRLLHYRPDIHIHHFHADDPQLDSRMLRRVRFYGRGTGAVVAKHKLPAWVVARGLIGPFYHALRARSPFAALILACCTVLGRAEGLVGWALWGDRQPNGKSASLDTRLAG